MKVFIIGVLPSSLYNFRGELIKALVEKGHEVVTLASRATDEDVSILNSMGAAHFNYPVSRNGLNVFEDLKTFLFLRNFFLAENPDVILAYTIKPVVWGGLAARFSGSQGFYGLVTGLGYAFQGKGFKRNALSFLVSFLYRQSLKFARGVVFQNADNRDVFLNKNLISESKSYLVNGSGVDLELFKEKPLPSDTKFLLIARLLGEKGIREYIKAAIVVKDKYPLVVFDLIGPEDPSPDGVPIDEILKYHELGVVNYRGPKKNVRPYIQECSVYVLPSYHEGIPRTVLEAMATKRPILTTDVPGCRETVINGENGWLVEKANVEQLAERMIWFVENKREWARMAKASRAMVEKKFDVRTVNSDILSILGLDK